MSRLFCSLVLLSIVGCTTDLVPAAPEGASMLTWVEGRITCITGSTCDPHAVERVPFEHRGDVSEAANTVLAYDCDSGWWDGPETVFAFDVQAPGTVRATLDASDDLGAFVVAVDEGYTCKRGGEQQVDVAVNPGRHWLIVDSRKGVEHGGFALALDVRDTHADDAYEPNDTLAQSTWFAVNDGDEKHLEGALTPASPIDYLSFEMNPLSAFELNIEGEGLAIELVTWDGPEPRYVERGGGVHDIYITDPWIEDFGDPVYATVTVEIRMTAEAWEKGGTTYTVRADHGYW